MIFLALAAALAQPVTEAEVEAVEPSKARYGGIAIPLISANTTDGLGFGLGGEFFRRPEDGSDGFVWKLQAAGYLTTSLEYQSYTVRFETRSGNWQWLLSASHRVWKDMLYSGVGGEDVLLLGDREEGNRLIGPLLQAGVRRPFAMDDALALYVQTWTRIHSVDPDEDGLLFERSPVGTEGGVYSDLTVGLDYEKVDRWPLPYKGARADVDLRAGVGRYKGDPRTYALVGAHAEFAGYYPLVQDRVVLGGRLLMARGGPKPFFEQDFTAGRRRDELGYEQPFTGYGRTRTRGDGAIAALVEFRPKIVESNHPFFDLELHLSVFAEEGFLMADGRGLGPHMPTIGGGPVLLWQGGTVLRPFSAWGWRAEAPGSKRIPVMQFGVALTDPL
ncbi:MAG: hypothetical protein KC912_11000 [Proteobacteria bacterium]|nr:hypothetical protein [Pseudomonadota bacterium]